MIIETARCLEEDIVATHNEADMGLIMGLGFPPFRGGALRYADTLGLAAVCEIADKYSHLGEVYQPTKRMREMATNGETYYKNESHATLCSLLRVKKIHLLNLK